MAAVTPAEPHGRSLGATGDEGDEPGPRGPWIWTVTWGVLARPGFAAEHVVAHDADEALVLAAQRHPERPRPRVAFLVAHQGRAPA